MSSPTPEPVVSTSSFGTPSPSENNNDERLPPRPVAHGAAVAGDAASTREHTLLMKRTLGVSHSSSATGAPPVRRGNGKRQKTAAAREDLCCFCSISSSCTSRNCPCAKAGRPCHSCDPGECNRCSNTIEALNRVIREENTRRTSGTGARFRRRVGRELEPTLPLHELGDALSDDDDEDELAGIENNNPPPPEHAVPPVDDQVDDSAVRPVLSPLVETDEDNDNDDASSTALGLAADGSDATTASTTALDHLVDGSDAPPASTTALGLPANESDLSEEGDVTDAGSDGNEVGPAGDGATATHSIPPVRQSTLFPIFRRGIARIGQSPATTALVRNETSVSAGVGGGTGTTARADCPQAARNASESGDAAASTSSLSAAVARASTSASAGARGMALGQTPAAPPATTSPDAEARQSGLPSMAARLGTGALAGETRTTPRAGPPPAAMAAPPAIAVHDDLGIETAGGDVEGVAQRAPTSSPSRAVDETTQTAAAAPATRGGAVVCRDGCAGGSCGETHVRTFVPAAILAATPPAVANPYLPVATATIGTAADAGGGGAAQRARGHFVPRHCTDAELRAEDPRLQRLTDADRRLCSVYGDTIHQNDGTHLVGGIGVAEDAKWQRLHLRVAACNLPLYDLPNGRWATRFLETLTNLWVGVVERRWNSERPLVFQACILRRVRGISRFHDVKPIIWGRLDAWDAERFVALVRAVEEATLDVGGGSGGPRAGMEDATSIARKYHNMVLGGKVRAAVRMVTNRGTGGSYRPWDLDSKSGHPVIEVLREKHPASRVPSEEDFDAHAGAPDCLDSMPVYCFEECVAKAAARLSGSAGPCGVDAEMLKNWLLRHGDHSGRLRDAMATWVDWLSNGSPPYAAYRAVNTVRTVALDKSPGVRPLGIGESWMRLWSDCSHTKTKVAATNVREHPAVCWPSVWHRGQPACRPSHLAAVCRVD